MFTNENSLRMKIYFAYAVQDYYCLVAVVVIATLSTL